jgi:hypothetical protein
MIKLKTTEDELLNLEDVSDELNTIKETKTILDENR